MANEKHVHVIGIAGSAMAPLAGMLRESGYRVTGSDSGVYPPASTLLDELGISYFNSFDAAHLLPTPDLVVVATSLREEIRSSRKCSTAESLTGLCPKFSKKFFSPASTRSL